MADKQAVSTTDPKVIIALDFDSAAGAEAFCEDLDNTICKLKVGKELFTRAGPQLVRGLIDRGFDVFLDLKFHDIPNTVARACKAAADLGVWMVNVHTLGGPAMLEQAAKAVREYSENRPLLTGVTILTSMDEAQLGACGIQGPVDIAVNKLARLAEDSGLDGVVCSALETRRLRQAVTKEFALVTPGIRPSGSSHDDQRRIATPAGAIRDGASYLVIGRPITQAADPMAVLLDINSEISSVNPQV